jgi:hypothetical protein
MSDWLLKVHQRSLGLRRDEFSSRLSALARKEWPAGGDPLAMTFDS